MIVSVSILVIIFLLISIICFVRFKDSNSKTTLVCAIFSMIVAVVVPFIQWELDKTPFPQFLTESQLETYIQYELQDNNVIYDLFVAPNDKNYTFIVPDKYLSCHYITRNGKNKIAKSGDKIYAAEARFIYSYINNTDNQISITDNEKSSKEYYSLYIDIHDTIAYNDMYAYGYPISDIRFEIYNEGGEAIGGGTSNGNLIEITNAYEGKFSILLKGEGFDSTLENIVLQKDNLSTEKIFNMFDGLYYDKNEEIVNMSRKYPIAKDYKKFWSIKINMRYSGKPFYSVKFRRFSNSVFENYVFNTENFILRNTSNEVHENNEVSLGMVVAFENNISLEFKMLEGKYYVLPYIQLEDSEDDLEGTAVTTTLNVYEQPLYIPKNINKDGEYQLKLNPISYDFNTIEQKTIDECGRRLMKIDE